MQRIKEFFSFDKKEAKQLISASLALGFVFSFVEWVKMPFSFSSGIIALANAALVVLFSLLVRVSIQKVVALYRGYKLKYEAWPLGLAIAFFIAFLMNGQYVYFAVPGAITLAVIEHLRVGKRRQSVMQSDTAFVAFTGIAVSLLLALIFKAISGPLSNQGIDLFVLVNLWMAVSSVLPIPPLDGFKIFYYSRMFSVFSIILVIASAVTLVSCTPLAGLIMAFSIAVFFAAVYFIIFELELGK
jgi:hypothetical protein